MGVVWICLDQRWLCRPDVAPGGQREHPGASYEGAGLLRASIGMQRLSGLRDANVVTSSVVKAVCRPWWGVGIRYGKAAQRVTID